MLGSSRDNGSILLEFLLVMPIYFALIGGTFWIGDLQLNRDNLLISDRLAAGHWGGRHDWDNDKRSPNDDTMRFRLNLWLFDILNQSIGDSAIVTGVEQSRYLQHAKYSWSQTVGSKTSLWVPLPSWTESWLRGNDESWSNALKKAGTTAVTSVAQLTSLIPDDVVGMNARVSEYDFLNVSLMRTKKGETGYRSWKPAKLCHECFSTSCNNLSCPGGVPVIKAVWYKRVYSEEYPLHSPDGLKQKMNSGNTDSERANCGSNDHSDYARFPTYVLWGQ